MKLYYCPLVCSLATHIALKEVGVTPELIKVDIKTHKIEDGSDFYEVNPLGSVPVLIDNGKKLSESIALLYYAAYLKPEVGLVPPAGSMESVDVLKLTSFIATEIHKNTPALLVGERAGPFGEYLKQKLSKVFAYLNSILENQEWLSQSGYSIADIYLFVVINWFTANWNTLAFNLPVELSNFKNIQSFHNRMMQRDSVKQALAEEGISC